MNRALNSHSAAYRDEKEIYEARGLIIVNTHHGANTGHYG